MLPIAKALLDHGADLEARDKAGATLLYLTLDVQKLDTHYNLDLFNVLV